MPNFNDIHEQVNRQVVDEKAEFDKKVKEIARQIEEQGIKVGDHVEIVFDNDLDNEMFTNQGPTKFKGIDSVCVQYSYYHPKDGSYVSGGTNVGKIKEIKLLQKSEDL